MSKSNISESKNQEAPKMDRKKHFEIMSQVICKLTPGMYVEPFDYRPYGLEQDVPNVVNAFFIHMPLSFSIAQSNQELKDIPVKRTFIAFLVDPPKYDFIKPSNEINLERECFYHWKREIVNDPQYQKVTKFASQYNWYLFSEYLESHLFAKVKTLCNFDGKHGHKRV